MADSTIDFKEIILYDRWPGEYETRVIPYSDSAGKYFTSAECGHNVTDERYPLGTKIQVWCDGNVAPKGWATLIYLCLAPVTEANPTCAAKQVVVPVDADEVYKVTNDPDRCLIATGSGLAAVMLSVMTPTFDTIPKYGWFWCGGVCPKQYVSDLTGTFATAVADVVVGAIVAHDLVADAIGFGVCAAVTEIVIGMALAADDT